MPYTLEYRPAEVFLEYQGVTIYHVYKDDDIEKGAREYWFDTQEDSQDEGGFDVRELADKLNISVADDEEDSTDTSHIAKTVIIAAIEARLLVND